MAAARSNSRGIFSSNAKLRSTVSPTGKREANGKEKREVRYLAEKLSNLLFVVPVRADGQRGETGSNTIRKA